MCFFKSQRSKRDFSQQPNHFLWHIVTIKCFFTAGCIFWHICSTMTFCIAYIRGFVLRFPSVAANSRCLERCSYLSYSHRSGIENSWLCQAWDRGWKEMVPKPPWFVLEKNTLNPRRCLVYLINMMLDFGKEWFQWLEFGWNPASLGDVWMLESWVLSSFERGPSGWIGLK